MKYLFLIMILTTHRCAESNDPRQVKEKHETQKKQFVNFINDDGEYARNYVDLTNNEANGFDDIFRGRGGGGSMLNGAMQLTENSMGGLALDGDDMEGTYNQLSANQLAPYENAGGRGTVHIFPALRRHLKRLFICKGNSDLPWMKLRMKCASSTLTGGQTNPGFSSDSSLGYNAPSFFGTFDVNTGSEDLISPFYSNEGKLEDNINLSDQMNVPGHIDMSSFNEALQGLNDKEESMMKASGKPKFVTNSGSVNSEFGEMDSSDEKLQKLLDSSTATNSDGSDEDAANSATVGSFINALLNQGNYNPHQDHLQPQQTASQDENQANNYDMNDANQYQQNQLNQLSGNLSPNGMGIQPVTVHVHASDKPGHKETSGAPSETSQAVAQQAQETAMKQHKAKLSRLKKRLALLREKLTELEDEQAKKSTSNKNNDPKQARNDAIKKLLIKNLKLAALIASKEIQLEEEKSRGVEYLSGKKEDGKLMEDLIITKVPIAKYLKSKPLTELSKKAEEEVNHLSNTDRVKSNSSLANTNHNQNKTKSDISKVTINRISKTLQALDTLPSVNQRSILGTSTRVFFNKLKKQIRLMSSYQAHGADEKGKDT